MQLLVIGMHRSGTSLVARMLNMLGAYFGPEGASLGCDIHNPLGYWERRDVCAINDALLEASGCCWHDVSQWTIGRLPTVSVRMRRKLRQLVMDVDAHRPWMIKDPRLCLTFPFWRPLLSVPVAIIVSRDPWSVARSLARRDGLTIEEGLSLWEFYALSALRTAPHPRIYLNYDDFTADPVPATARLKALLEHQGVTGLRLPSPREILTFVQPRQPIIPGRGVEPQVPERQVLVAALRGDRALDELPQLSAATIDVLAAHARQRRPAIRDSAARSARSPSARLTN